MQQEFQIDPSRKQCHQCGRRFQPLDEYICILREADPDESPDAPPPPSAPPQPAPPPPATTTPTDQDIAQAAAESAAPGEAETSTATAAAEPETSPGESPETTPETSPAAKALGLSRRDYCPDCAPPHDIADKSILAFWRSRLSPPEAPKKNRGLIIDEKRLLEVFFRLADTTDAARLDFRYVIALMLIRKRKLKVEGTRRRRDGSSVTLVRKPRTKELHELCDRNLSDEAVIKVSQDIGELLDLIDAPQADDSPDQQGD